MKTTFSVDVWRTRRRLHHTSNHTLHIERKPNSINMPNLRPFRTFALFLGLLLLSDLAYIAAQRSTGGRNVLRRNYTGKKPVVIQHRTQDAVNYYDHENGAKIIKSSHFELDYTLGRKITFFCMAQGNPRPTITWFKDGAELYQHRFFQVHESHIETDIIKSKMEIDPTTQMDAGYYECQADNIYAIDRRGFRTDYVMVNF